MNSKSAEQKTSRSTPDGLKKMLIVLLILSAVAGHASTVYLTIIATSNADNPAATGIRRPLLETLKAPEQFETVFTENIERFQIRQISGVKDLFREITEPEGTLHSFTFQGTLSGERGAIAIINDHPIAVNAEIDGVRVVAISDRMVVLEYQKNTKEVLVGETVSVYINDN